MWAAAKMLTNTLCSFPDMVSRIYEIPSAGDTKFCDQSARLSCEIVPRSWKLVATCLEGAGMVALQLSGEKEKESAVMKQ